ncbi:MAG: nuclear transport factor 2 family protein [Pseudomonadota bacterium]
MNKDNIAIAENYYAAMNKQDAAGMENCLHPDVQLITLLAEKKGREAVLNAAVRIASFAN